MTPQEETKTTKTFTPFTWTKVKHEAARAIAEGEDYDKEIAARLNVHYKTLYNWQCHPEFKERIRHLRQVWGAQIMRTGIALKENRVKYLNGLHKRQDQIIQERAIKHGTKSPTPNVEPGAAMLPEVAGGGSGLIVVDERTYTPEGGSGSVTTREESFDAALSREVRATLAQAGEETGQIVSKHELTGKDGGPLEMNIGIFDAIGERVRAARKRNEEARASSGESSETS